MAIGSFAFVLHAHSPYILGYKNGQSNIDWLYESCTETYIPLLNMLNRLINENSSPKITINISPILIEQLKSYDFPNQFLNYLQNKVDKAIDNQLEFKEFNQPCLYHLAKWWQEYYTHIMIDFIEKYRQDIIEYFKRLQDDGHIEIISSCATDSYLPLLSRDSSIAMQIKLGIESYKKYFGIKPRGFLLPEYAYYPESFEKEKRQRKKIEEFLIENGIDYFLMDSHKSDEDVCTTRSPYEVYLINSNKAQIVSLVRDNKTGFQVWNNESGYLWNGWYLDLYKKHFQSNHRYWRITSADSDIIDKLEYEPDKIEYQIKEDARHFNELIKTIFSCSGNGHNGIVVAAFNAELFGHQWFEGIKWMEYVIKLMNNDNEIRLTTCSEYLDQTLSDVMISLPKGSSLEEGSISIRPVVASPCACPDVEWTWKHIHKAEETMEEILSQYRKSQDNKIQEILKQLAIELLLLQSSDWQSLISTWKDRDYANERILKHFEAFNRIVKLCKDYASGEDIAQGDWNFFLHCQKRETLFEIMDLNWFEI